jgi:hypothetical protein
VRAQAVPGSLYPGGAVLDAQDHPLELGDEERSVNYQRRAGGLPPARECRGSAGTGTPSPPWQYDALRGGQFVTRVITSRETGAPSRHWWIARMQERGPGLAGTQGTTTSRRAGRGRLLHRPGGTEATCLDADAVSLALPLQQAQQRPGPRRASCLLSRARWRLEQAADRRGSSNRGTRFGALF